ncbi:4Fe-4S binding protein [Clostridium sp. AM58-1XD]|uniref:4Fe-4S binding protein n=1 Tax=Clostridium sp. AM58-1XD TaxID=2292307 RepID=UPI000E4AF6B9|nr:4Fe-4S binding protein [Clostridium sp. AM58-1XD]RGY96014.1 epoxyqueuosine reductase [Clostridium sp. AM58-1XD]
MLDRGKAADFVEKSPKNYISREYALSDDVVGMKIFEAPVFAVGDAQDEYFRKLKEPQAVGPHFMLPQEWLPGAKRVVSFFLPFSREIKKSNLPFVREPSNGWLHGRIEGQAFLMDVCRFLKKELESEGEKALIPLADPRFRSVEEAGSSERFKDKTTAYTSSWSERHVAYVCGLGTFSLSKGLITEKGVCGRFGSIVTTMELPVTERPYKGLYDYCTFCGACISHCPVGAISLENGKDHEKCRQHLKWTTEEYAPRYGCGKCQVQVPCMSRIPGR